VVSAMGPPGAACADVERLSVSPYAAERETMHRSIRSLVRTRSWSFDESTG